MRYIIFPITPKHNLFVSALAQVERNVNAALIGPVKREVKGALEKRTTGWRVRPVMAALPSKPRDAFGALYVFPRGAGREIWVWLSKGVAGHDIYPKASGGKLNVRLGYVPKTTAGGGFGGPGTYGGPNVGVTFVKNWPGIDPRKFEEKVIQEVELKVFALIAQAVRLALP